MPEPSATGTLVRYIPKGVDRDELLGLVRMGLVFQSQQCGRRPGVLANLVLNCARRAGKPHTFAKLLGELEIEAARRELRGEQASPIEKVDRVWQLVTLHTKAGREQKPFGTIRWHLTQAKIKLRGEI